MSAGPFLEAFISLIVIPLILALLTQWWSNKKAVGTRVLHAAGWLPVPFMAMTLFVIVASQISKLYISPDYVRYAIPVYVAYMIIVPVIARILAGIFRLDVGAGRALIFSAGTRNSLVVLPFALALPEGLREGVTVVIVTQTIIELIGELIYVRAVPHLLMRDSPHGLNRYK